MSWGVAVVVGLVAVAIAWVLLRATRLSAAPSSAAPPNSIARIRGRTVEYSQDGLSAVIHGHPMRCRVETSPAFRSTSAQATGDAIFDSDFVVFGAPADVLSLLDEALRRRVERTFTGCQVSISEGMTRLVVSRKSSDLVRVVSDAIVLLEDLERANACDVKTRLFDRATGDPVGQVRRRALIELLSAFSDSPEAAEARQLASEDADPDVRRCVLADTEGAVTLLRTEGPQGQLSPPAADGRLSPVKK